MKSKLLLLAASLVFSFKAAAFTINPARLELTPGGKGGSGVIQVSNESTQEAQVSIFMMARTHDEFGKEVRKEFDIKKNFLILPANLTLKPKSSASVRIVYIGPKEMENEVGYRLIFAGAKPQPLSRSSKDGVTAAIDVLLSYAASVWVGKPDAKPSIRMTGMKSVGGKDYMVLTNEGKRRTLINSGNLIVKDDKLKAPEKYPTKSLAGLEEPIMAGETRFVEFPKDSKANRKTMKVEFGE